MPKHRVVVEADFGVERVDFVVFRGDERINLGQRSIGIDAGLRERDHCGSCGIYGRHRHADTECKLARLIGLQADPGIDHFFENGFWCLVRDFFDIHAARGGSHEDQLAGAAIEHDAEIKFLRDGQSFFNEQALHETAFGTGLVRDERHTQNLFRDDDGFSFVLRDFDNVAALAAGHLRESAL